MPQSTQTPQRAQTPQPTQDSLPELIEAAQWPTLWTSPLSNAIALKEMLELLLSKFETMIPALDPNENNLHLLKSKLSNIKAAVSELDDVTSPTVLSPVGREKPPQRLVDTPTRFRP